MGLASSCQARSAAERNDVGALQEIASTQPHALLRQSLLKQRSALHCAARAGATEALCAVLDVAAHRRPGALLEFLNAPDYAGNTACALACKHGYVDCLRELLEAGASPLPANTQGATALHLAAARGHAAAIRLLLTTTVRLADGSRCPAAQAPVPDVVDMERYIDTRTHAGLCALHLAVLCGSQASVAELVNHGAQLDTPLLPLRIPLHVPPCLGPGSTALHMAAATGRLPLCVLILHAQQQRHPGLELRRLRNARGMTPLNIALVCDHRNLASLLTAGAPVPPPPAPRGRGPPGQLTPLLRQQLLALVHRATLLSQLRSLGLGSAGAAAAPPLPGLAAGPISRLEALLHSDAATAGQVLALVDELLEEAAATAQGEGGRSSSGRSAAAGGGGSSAALRGSAGAGSSAGRRRRERRRQQEQREALAQLAAAQTGVDWTLLERNRSLWHAEHGDGSLNRRLRRRHDRHRTPPALAAAAQPVGPPAVPGAAAAGEEPEQALMLAGALLQPAEQEEEARNEAQRQQLAQQQQEEAGGSSWAAEAGSSRRAGSTSGGGASSSSSESGRSSQSRGAVSGAAAAGRGQQQEEAQQGKQEGKQVASLAASQADGAICPICLDLPAEIAIIPCSHQACLACCGRLASYCPSGSSGTFGLPATGPLCPLCRAPIESFRKHA